MNREPTEVPLKTWQFYSACIHHLGKSYLQNLYKKATRQIHRWAANPDTTESHQRNPIDRYETLLNKLMARGHVDDARAIVRRQAHIVGCLLAVKEIPISDKATLAEECLDDVPALAEYHRVLTDPETTVDQVREAMAAVTNEIRENYDRFCRERKVTP